MTTRKNKKERLEEFLNYHLNGDGEANGIILKEYADAKQFSDAERFDLAFFYSVTYCIISSLFLIKNKDKIVGNPHQFAKETKKKIIFQSDRRYVRVGENYSKLLQLYSSKIYNNQEKIIDSMKKNGQFNMMRIENTVGSWWFFGRFSTYLFAETVGRLFGQNLGVNSFDWEHGDTATSGMLNLLGYDKSADYFDKTGRLPKGLNTKQLDIALQSLQQKIKARGGTPITAEIETSLCAYRKFYKGSRYNGYYLDRILEELIWFENNPEMHAEIQELYRIRKRNFAEKYLGEVSGWTGVRKRLKTFYKETGMLT